MNIKYKNQNELAKKVLDIKSHLPIKMLCENVPKEMNEYMKYVKSLQFEEEPNYNYLSNIFQIMLKKINKVNDFHFSWINESLTKKNVKISSKLSKRRISPFSKIIERFRLKSTKSEIIDKIDLSDKNKAISYHKSNTFSKTKEQKESNKLENNNNSKQINIKYEVGNKTESNKGKISIFKTKSIYNKLIKPKYIIKKNSLAKKRIINSSIKNTQLSPEILNTNFKPNLTITPIISNKILNIYSNGFNKPNINNNSHFKNSDSLLIQNNNTLNYYNDELFKKHYNYKPLIDLNQITYKRLFNEDNYKDRKGLNTISDFENNKIFSVLNTEINYKRKFNQNYFK